MNKSLYYVTIAACLFSVVMLTGAFVIEYAYDILPCKLCWWQRWAYLLAAFFGICAINFVNWRKILVILSLVSILASGSIGIYQMGIEKKLWPNAVSCLTPIDPLKMSFEDFQEALEHISEPPCEESAWSYHGLSLSLLNGLAAIGFCLGALFILYISKKEE